MPNYSFKCTKDRQCMSVCELENREVIYWHRDSLVRPLWYHNVRGSDLIRSFSCGTWGTHWWFEREAPFFPLWKKKAILRHQDTKTCNLCNVALHANVLFVLFSQLLQRAGQPLCLLRLSKFLCTFLLPHPSVIVQCIPVWLWHVLLHTGCSGSNSFTPSCTSRNVSAEQWLIPLQRSQIIQCETWNVKLQWEV